VMSMYAEDELRIEPYHELKATLLSDSITKMPSTIYVPLVSEQPTAAIMDPSGQHLTEKSAHCCQNHSCANEDRKCRSSRLRRLVFPTALALLLLIAALFALSCLYDRHLSNWGFGELLPRATSTSGSPFVKNKCMWLPGSSFVFFSPGPFQCTLSSFFWA
jgi:hypothetical protein